MAQNIFNTVQYTKVPSNIFDMSYDHKLSGNFGDLIPIHVQECIPGDKIRMGSDMLLRMAPMIAPVMHRVNATVHHFFVPNRLVWKGWEDFITGGQNPEVTPAFPYFTNLSQSVGSLSDYLGLPTGVAIDFFSAIPFAAYGAIWNEYYRDQNLITPIDYQLSDGNNVAKWAALSTLRKRAWQHDMFTGALPFAQKGPSVSIPIGTYADVPVVSGSDAITQWRVGSGSFDNGNVQASGIGGTTGVITDGAGDPLTLGNALGANVGLTAKTSQLTATAATINNLRVAFRLQEWFEKNARGGSRYIENILAHFGVRTKDYRLNRPEYLGGSKQPVVISEVLQTSQTSTTPQGTMAGHGVSAGGGKNFSYYVEEHGYIMSIMSIMPVTAYQQGIPKHFKKFDRLSYGWPTFAHLGEQEVKNWEIYVGTDGLNDATFGYVPRYAEYRFNPSRVSGDMRTTLNFWHMGRIFSSRPNLNQSFIEMDNSSINRVFAVTTGNKFYAHVFHRIKATRKLPKYGTPAF